MSCTVAQLKSFLAELNDDDEIAIDDGGLCLVTLPEQLFSYEIGGVPLDDEPEPDTRCSDPLYGQRMDSADLGEN